MHKTVVASNCDKITFGSTPAPKPSTKKKAQKNAAAAGPKAKTSPPKRSECEIAGICVWSWKPQNTSKIVICISMIQMFVMCQLEETCSLNYIFCKCFIVYVHSWCWFLVVSG